MCECGGNEFFVFVMKWVVVVIEEYCKVVVECVLVFLLFEFG